MPRISKKADLRQAGLGVMLRRGYAACGVRELTAAAGAPLGSFSNHYRSKESFAADVLDLYFEQMDAVMASTIDDASRAPRARIDAYLDRITERLAADKFERGCLIGDFSLEIPSASEELRRKLLDLYARWERRFAACIKAGQKDGSIRKDMQAGELAELLITGWEGAILRAKVTRAAAPLERFRRTVLPGLLGPSR